MSTWVAPAFRRLVAVFYRDELSSKAAISLTLTSSGKFVAAERVDQPAKRRRYPEGNFAVR